MTAFFVTPLVLCYVAGYLYYSRYIVGFLLFSCDYYHDGFGFTALGIVGGLVASLFWPLIVSLWAIRNWYHSRKPGNGALLRKLFKEPKFID